MGSLPPPEGERESVEGRIMRARGPLGALALVAAFAASARGEFPNKHYRAWAEFKVGSWVTIESVAAVTSAKTKTTTKLLEVTPLRVVLETTVTTPPRKPGGGMVTETRREEIPATVPHPTGDEPMFQAEEGDEVLAIGDKKVKCHWIHKSYLSLGKSGEFKTWTSAEVPGLLVRREDADSVRTVVAFEKK
jgi:hypothetical protein